MEISEQVAIEVDRSYANYIREKVKALGLQSPLGLIRKENSTLMLVPVSRRPTDDETNQISQKDSATITIQIVTIQSPQSTAQKSQGPYEKMSEILSKQSIFTQEAISHLPKKWDRIGHVLIIKKLHLEYFQSLENSQIFEHHIANALLDVVGNGTETVVVDEQGVSGELRTPCSIRVLVNRHQGSDPLETVHVENGVQYEINVGKIMFSSGNGTERIHFANIKLNGNETVVDMFTGIGYFSMPLAYHNRYLPEVKTEKKKKILVPSNNRLICLEKNPDSFQYLQRNIIRNNVSQWVTPFLGDNREVASDFLGQADRVMMGYIPTPKQFLHRAFDFLKPSGGIVHYHHTCMKEEYKTLAEAHVREELESWLAKNEGEKDVKLLDFRVVKNYAPKLFHCVGDFLVYNK